MPLHVAYLVNQYPMVSHSFIRREIHALERLGARIERFAVRGWDESLPDAQDAEERAHTRYLLRAGMAALGLALVEGLFASPRRFVRGLILAARSARRSDKSTAHHVAYLAEACLLMKWLRGTEVRHVHAHFGTNGAQVAMLTHCLGGPPFSFTVHGPEEFDKPQALWLAEKVRRCTFVATISSFGRSQMFRWIEARDWGKVQVVHCGLEGAFHAHTASPPPTAKRLICVGRISEQKGQLLLVDAARLLTERGVDFELVLAGDGEMRPQVEAAVERYRLGDRVRITGWIAAAQVREELLAARALVLPSFAEGLPVVIMEAMSLCRPILSTFVAGIPELVQAGESGWLFPAGDVEALANSMMECLETSDGTMIRMGAAARQRVLTRHDIDTEAAKLYALFEQAVASGDRAKAS